MIEDAIEIVGVPGSLIKFIPFTPKFLSAIGFLVIYEVGTNHTEKHNINSVLE
jgi:hypothetical protein